MSLRQEYLLEEMSFTPVNQAHSTISAAPYHPSEAVLLVQFHDAARSDIGWKGSTFA